MTGYKAPLEDMLFLLDLFALEGSDGVDNASDLTRADKQLVLEQAGRFVETELATINADCDRLGCQWDGNQVRLPEAMKQALASYAKAGWLGTAMPTAWGGQELPETLASCVGEMVTAANPAFSMFPALTTSACRALMQYGSQALKDTYLPKLVSGEWLGCMALTEPHCGSDLGLIRTSAERQLNSHYAISGNKIFISAGIHDGTSNSIHLVLARVSDAPAGIKGLSLFLVPQYLKGEFNEIHCLGLEEKMGIHANPTCSIRYEGALGYLVGEENQGIRAMFAMMNEMRLGAALQGVGLNDASFQVSLKYAEERQQGRALSGPKAPKADADPLLVHGDVRRMLMNQKAFTEGNRALVQFCAQLLDKSRDSGSDSAEESQGLLALLTPLAKAFCTETGLESASQAIQVHGGHGFIRESGVEQLYRDGRISTIYEGTTGIQAMDFLGRKILFNQMVALKTYCDLINRFCAEITPEFSSQAQQLTNYTKQWLETTEKLSGRALANFDEVGAAAYDYLMYAGYISLGYFWLRMATYARCDSENFSPSFLQAKVDTMRYYFARVLPRADAHEAIFSSGADTVFAPELAVDAAGPAI